MQSFLYLRKAFLPSEPGTGKGVLLGLQIFKILLSAATRIQLNFGVGERQPKRHSDFPVDFIFFGGQLTINLGPSRYLQTAGLINCTYCLTH